MEAGPGLDRDTSLGSRLAPTFPEPAQSRRPSVTMESAADGRIQKLLGDAAWARLPRSVQRRFSTAMTAGDVKIYAGHVETTTLSRTGQILARLAQLIGSPLPLDDGAKGPALVAVTQDPATGNQYWVRTYTRPKKRPQVVSSAKRFCGPTGLEEYVGYGIGMTLRLKERDGALLFCSERFFIEWRRFRVYVPRLLSPGQMEICHRNEAVSSFVFELTFKHPRLGLLLHQVAHFRDGEVRLNGRA